MLDLGFDFTFITKTFSDNHIGTTTSYPEAIDHQLISKPLKAYYVSNSTKLFTLNQYIPNYSNTTSDHYPVYSSFSRRSSKTNYKTTTNRPLVYLNSSLSQLIITGEVEEGQIKLYNMLGSCVMDQPIIASQSFDISRLQKGYYLVSMITNQGIITQKIALF